MNTQRNAARLAIRLAFKHRLEGKMASSACVCLNDAEHLFQRGFYDYARQMATRSLAYSVGIGSPDYQKAFKPINLEN